MKIIDLLNKIANNEEVPKEIKYKDNIYKYNPNNQDYEKDSCDCLFSELFYKLNTTEFINDEIEILEEPNKLEKIDLSEWSEITYELDNKTLNNIFANDFNRNTKCFVEKINELIDHINKLEKESE